ncbi:MAG: NrpR regulatory domain-containing protein [Candidatus Margulisbacteria bacterium]|nr:NrpR regulatory domain-containing protein [Candidatus Margulisiibacteriota bacterium]
MNETDRKTNAILKIISEVKGPIGSVEIAEKLKEQGIEMSERTVRYHLKLMNEKGLTKIFWKEGRMITSKGMEELGNALVSDKIGLMSSRIETMAYKMDFDLYEKQGRVLLNISLIKKSDFNSALKVMSEIFKKKLTTGDRVAVAEAGKDLGGLTVPPDRVGFGTLCSVNLNGILLKHSIPVESKFGGLLQIENDRPLRFTEMISYSGSSLDPHEIFIKSKMTGVRDAAAGSGKILAGLREIPAASVNEAEAIIRKAESAGIGRVLMIGKAGQALLGMPVGAERVGIVVPGGLNPVAAVEESGLETTSKALVTLADYDQLINFWDI